MGWCSGTQVFDDVVNALIGGGEVDKKTVIILIIKALEDMDWDCQPDSDYYTHPLVKECFREIHPEWFTEVKCPKCGEEFYIEE